MRVDGRGAATVLGPVVTLGLVAVAGVPDVPRFAWCDGSSSNACRNSSGRALAATLVTVVVTVLQPQSRPSRCGYELLALCHRPLLEAVERRSPGLEVLGEGEPPLGDVVAREIAASRPAKREVGECRRTPLEPSKLGSVSGPCSPRRSAEAVRL